jgi:hypothetical protein
VGAVAFNPSVVQIVCGCAAASGTRNAWDTDVLAGSVEAGGLVLQRRSLWWVEGEREQITLPSSGVRLGGSRVAGLGEREPVQEIVAAPGSVRQEQAEDPAHLWDREAGLISPPAPA